MKETTKSLNDKVNPTKSNDIDFKSLEKGEELSIFNDFVPLSPIKYYFNGFVDACVKAGKWLFSFVIDVCRAFLSIFIGIYKIIKGIFIGVYNFFSIKIYRYFKEDDIWGKLSYVFLGTSSLANKQYVNGFLYVLTEILYIVYMVLTGGRDLYRLSGPGIEGPETTTDIFGVTVTVGHDNSVVCLILGIIAVVITLLFVYIWYRNINAAHSNTIVRFGNRYFDGYKTVKEYFKDDKIDAFAYATVIKPNGHLSKVGHDSYFRKEVGFTKETSSVICYKNFTKMFKDVPELYKLYFLSQGITSRTNPTKEFYLSYNKFKDNLFNEMTTKNITNEISLNDIFTFKPHFKFDKKSITFRIQGKFKVDSTVAETLFNVYCDFLKYYQKNLFSIERSKEIYDSKLYGVEDYYSQINDAFVNYISVEQFKDLLLFVKLDPKNLNILNVKTLQLKVVNDYNVSTNNALEVVKAIKLYFKYREEQYIGNKYNNLLLSHFELDFKRFYKDYLIKKSMSISLFNVENDSKEILSYFLSNNINELSKSEITSKINSYYGTNDEDIGLESKYYELGKMFISELMNSVYKIDNSMSISTSFHNIVDNKIDTLLAENKLLGLSKEEFYELLDCFDADDVKYTIKLLMPKYVAVKDVQEDILRRIEYKSIKASLKELKSRLKVNQKLLINEEFTSIYVNYLDKVFKVLSTNKAEFIHDFEIEEKNFHFEYDKYNIYRPYLDFNNAFLNVARNSKEIIDCFYNLDNKNISYNQNTKFTSEEEKTIKYDQDRQKIIDRYDEIFNSKKEILVKIAERKKQLSLDLLELKTNYTNKIAELKASNASEFSIVSEKENYLANVTKLKEQATIEINKLDGQYNGLQADKLISKMRKEELEQLLSGYKRSLKINVPVESTTFGKEIKLASAVSNIVSNFTCSTQVAKASAKAYKKAIDTVKVIKKFANRQILLGKSHEEINELISNKFKLDIYFNIDSLINDNIPYKAIISVAEKTIIERSENRMNSFINEYGSLEYCGQAKPFKKTVNSLLTDKFHAVVLFIPVLGAAIVTILPLASSLLIAFTNYDAYHNYPNLFTWVGLNNFIGMFTGSNSIFGSATVGAERIPATIGALLGWTLIWAFFATFTNYFLGIIVALLINKKSIKLKKLWRTIFVLTIAIPQFISLLSIANMLGATGPINFALTQNGMSSIPFLTDDLLAKVMIIVVNVWVGVPYTILMASGILMNIPTDLYESSRIDGASPVTQFFKITMPYMFFITGPSLITNFVSNINNFNIIFFLTQDKTNDPNLFRAKSTDLLINWLYTLTTGTSTAYNLSASLGIIIFVICAFFSLVMYSRLGAVQREDQFQ